MSSQISANANDLFVRPPEIDEGAYLRIRQMRLSQSVCRASDRAAKASTRRGKNGIIQTVKQGRTWQRDF